MRYLILCVIGLAAIPLQLEADYEFQEGVVIPMRDGVQLSANIYLPRQGGRYPVILSRSPYGIPGKDFGSAKRYTDAGYVIVMQDCRGRGRSQGVWDPFHHDADDGFDTQQWIGRQPWCNGEIGTMGGSYLGWTQWASAAEGSPYLKAMVPVVPFGDVYEFAYPGGAFQLSLLFGWGAGVGGIPVPPTDLPQAMGYLPLNRWDGQFQREVFFLRDWIAHPAYDAYWRQRGLSEDQFAQIDCPVLNIGGWYDIFAEHTIDLIDKVRNRSQDRLARRSQCVIIGPWGHGVGGQQVGELDFGPQARLDVEDVQFKWFEYWLQDRDTGVEDWPAYRLFVMGANRWRNEDQWPLANTKWTRFYLHSQGKANSRKGDGSLSESAPSLEPADSFVYDPNDPVPTHGGNNLVVTKIGPYDQSHVVEERQDVLVYVSAPLEKPIEITGPIQFVLYASTTAPDTDFTGKLVDIHPDGKAYNLSDGIVRARYRQSKETATLIEPGKIHAYQIDLGATSNVFMAGHRIGVEVSSSNFPRFDRNPNTGQSFGSDTELRLATQQIYHDAEHSSHLVLPVIEER